MTAPGGIQPLNSVPTAPMYFSQSPGLAAQLAPTTRLLLEAIKQHQDQVDKQAEFDRNRQSGDLMAQLSIAASAPSTLGGTIPTTNLGSDQIGGQLGTVAPITIKPDLLSNRLATALKGRPGEVVMDALKGTSNQITAAQAAEDRQRAVLEAQRVKAATDPFTSGEVDIQQVGKKRELWAYNKRTNKLTPLLKPDGTIATAPEHDTAAAQGSFMTLENADTGDTIAWNPTTRTAVPAPAGFSKQGQITENQRRSAQLYRPAALAYKQLQQKNFGSLKFGDAVLIFAALRGDPNAVKEAGIRRLLTPENRALVRSYSELIGNIAYAKSGAQINEREFSAQRNLIPWADDPEPLRQDAIALMRENLVGLYGTGYRALVQGKKQGVGYIPIENIADPKALLTPNDGVITDPNEADLAQ